MQDLENIIRSNAAKQVEINARIRRSLWRIEKARIGFVVDAQQLRRSNEAIEASNALLSQHKKRPAG